jgi:hypothetical protein
VLEDQDGLKSRLQLDRQAVVVVTNQLALDSLAVEKAHLDGLALGPIQPPTLDDVVLKFFSSWSILGWGAVDVRFLRPDLARIHSLNRPEFRGDSDYWELANKAGADC